MATKVRVRFEGVEDFRRLVRRLGDTVDEERKEMHRDAARIVEKEMLRRVPVRSGALKDDIRSAGYKASGVVRAGRASVPYAGVIQWGWPTRPFGDWVPGAAVGGPIKADPYMTDAMEARDRDVTRSFEKDVAAIFRKYD